MGQDGQTRHNQTLVHDAEMDWTQKLKSPGGARHTQITHHCDDYYTLV